MALWVLLGLVALLEYSVGIAAIAAIATGRIWAPWALHRVRRPTPWGWAQLLGAAMLTIYPLHFGLGVNIPVMAVLTFSLILMIASAVLNHFALKAPRTPPG
ncbi:hypothetical protein C8250_042790 [Streptomyces sp. So13.3]|uniref:hypothetical protein n=1 Tax=unclassified Streptomyces TaxID=2593676 RepID=UPI0011073425|nr:MULTISPECIES: hypothetical protein [unclassified Streptomyces]MCZ4102318.1 hypothetical protein [Streptomyces sp. H39-C1]QNA77601.1 hypothetical protein C8250_042790 [Streptomyces sp. So13.3]